MSENIGGGLAFQATLNIDDFKVSADAMERRIRNVSTTAVQESERMEQSIAAFAQNGARYIIGTLVGGGMMGLVNSIVQTRGQFQQLQIAFDTMLGSGAKSKALMDQLTNTAAKTPFDLMGVAGGAKQLLAYGSSADKVNDTLVRLGNIASGLSIPLNDIVYLYGTTMVQGRLYAQDVRQFTGRGIPLVRELAAMYGKTAEEINTMVSEGKIGFPEVEKVINKMTDSGGQFYNLMERQSKSLTGMISNLGDSWDMALNKLGEENQGILESGISGAITVVEHLDDVLRIVKSIAVAYGSYKAAIVLNTLATKGYTGVSLIDNTVRQAKIALMANENILSGKEIAQSSLKVNSHREETAALEAKLTSEEKENVLRAIRISTIQGILTAQQQETLSLLGLTTASKGYEAAALELLTAQQRESLGKIKLTTDSTVYRTAIYQEVAAKRENLAATLETMRADVKAAALKVEETRATSLQATQRVAAARMELNSAIQSGNATKVATAEKKLQAAVDNQLLVSNAKMAAVTDFKTKKTILETEAKRQSVIASQQNVVADQAQIVTKSLLGTVTTGLIAKLRALWATMMANPLTAVLSVLGLVISGLTLFGNKKEDITDASKEFEDQTQKEISSLNTLMSVIRSTNEGTQARKSAIEKLNSMLGAYNLELLKENATVQDVTKKYNELTVAIKSSTAARLQAQGIEKIQNEKSKNDDESFGDFKSGISGIRDYQTAAGGVTGSYTYATIPEWVQKMNDETYQYLNTYISESAQKLKTQSGAQYQAAFNEVMNTTIKMIAGGVQISEKEAGRAIPYIKNLLSDYIKSANSADAKTNSLTGSLERMTNIKMGKMAVTGDVDYMAMSFEDLEKKAQETQGEIDKINGKTVKVNTDNTKLTQLLGLLHQVNSAIDNKTKNLNTEAGINARVKDLKDERANVEINSAKYKELTKTIDKLEAKIPKQTKTSKSSENSAANKAQQLAEKQIQAQLKAEQSRIDIMDEGYAKRKALLELQHKQNIAQINKEEKELEKARREAGKSGLSLKEKSEFNDRRTNENASYTKNQNKLFDGEIEYKKSQYELYWRWVESMGDKVANERFKDLLKSGGSYKEYLENELQRLTVDDGKALTERQGKTGLSDGEVNYLAMVKSQLKGVLGEKTALDAFKESFTQAINRANTLAEKLKVIADFQERLDNGKSNLVGADDKAAGNLAVSEKKDETDKEVQEKVLADFKTYEEKRLSIQKEYALLREQAIKDGNMAAIAEINKGEAQKISALFTENLMNSDEWKQLFGNLDNLTVSKMIELRDKIEASWEQIKLSPEALNELRKRIDEVTRTIGEKNPFQALLDSIKRYKKDSSKINFSELMKSSSAALGATKEVFDSVVSGIKTMGIEMDENTENMLNDIGGVIDGASQLAAGIASGNPLSIIQGSISVISHGLSLLDSGSDRRNKRLQEEIEYYNKLVEVYNTLIDKQKELTESLSGKDALQAYQEGIGMINAKIVAARSSLESWFAKGAGMFSHSNWYKYDKDMGDVLSRQKLLTMSAKEWTSFMKDNADQWAKLPDEVKTYAQNVIDAGLETEDLAKIMKEAVAGFTLDDASNSIMELASQAELTFKSISGSFSKLMQDAILRLVKSKVVDNSLQRWYDNFSNNMSDGVLSDDEVKARQDEYKDLVEQANEQYKKMMEAAGVSLDSATNEDPTTGAVKSLSEETGGIVAGKLNAVVINQADGLSLLRQSLIIHQQIADNTSYCRKLEAIDSTLKRIESSGSSLLSQGIS